MADEEPIQLEAGTGEFKPVHDPRPHMEEPLPVNLVAVADVTLVAPGGLELSKLEAFYVGMWGFERDQEFEGAAFRAENFRIIFNWETPIVERDGMRALGVEVESLVVAEQKLNAAEIEYLKQKGLQPGTESLLLQDPAGNWIELTERRGV